MAHQSVSVELQHTQQATVLLLSAGGPRDFTASESPFSYLMSTLTLPQIRARNKGSFNRVGVAWTGKDCLVDDCVFSRFCFSFLRARLLRTIFRRSAQGNSTFVCGLRAGGRPVSATRNTLGQRACVSMCVWLTPGPAFGCADVGEKMECVPLRRPTACRFLVRRDWRPLDTVDTWASVEHHPGEVQRKNKSSSTSFWRKRSRSCVQRVGKFPGSSCLRYSALLLRLIVSWLRTSESELWCWRWT